MSLKAFHILFITAATALAFGCGISGFKDYFSPEGHVSDLLFGLGSFVAGGALIIYERYFLKKTRNVDFL